MYYQKAYPVIDEKAILKDAFREGFSLTLMTDKAGFIHTPHTHSEATYIVIVSGSLEAKIKEDVYECRIGDKLIIPGSTVHSAVIGPEGCRYFWSDRVIK